MSFYCVAIVRRTRKAQCKTFQITHHLYSLLSKQQLPYTPTDSTRCQNRAKDNKSSPSFTNQTQSKRPSQKKKKKKKQPHRKDEKSDFYRTRTVPQVHRTSLPPPPPPPSFSFFLNTTRVAIGSILSCRRFAVSVPTSRPYAERRVYITTARIAGITWLCLKESPFPSTVAPLSLVSGLGGGREGSVFEAPAGIGKSWVIIFFLSRNAYICPERESSSVRTIYLFGRVACFEKCFRVCCLNFPSSCSCCTTYSQVGGILGKETSS